MASEKTTHEVKHITDAFNGFTRYCVELDATVADLRTKNDALTKELQATRAERDKWKQKCETMGDHPDVLAAAAAKAEENAKAANANLARAKQRLAAKAKA